MTFLVIDIETSGLPRTSGFARFYPPHDFKAYDGARIIEIASIEYDDGGREVSSVVTRVSPSGQWVMNPTSQLIHGIDPIDLVIGTVGVNHIKDMLDMLFQQLQRAFDRTSQGTPVMVGHNISFDWHVVAAEACRLGHFALFDLLCGVSWHCTMRETTQLCGLRRQNGSVKWPTLGELYMHLFDEQPSGAHSALGDVHATARCFFHLRFRPSPRVAQTAQSTFHDNVQTPRCHVEYRPSKPHGRVDLEDEKTMVVQGEPAKVKMNHAYRTTAAWPTLGVMRRRQRVLK